MALDALVFNPKLQMVDPRTGTMTRGWIAWKNEVEQALTDVLLGLTPVANSVLWADGSAVPTS